MITIERSELKSIAMKSLLCFSAFLFLFTRSFSNELIPLTGRWNVVLDHSGVAKAADWQNLDFNDTIMLPGTLGDAGYGTRASVSDYGRLTPLHKYVGKAWYQKKITVPRHWEDKQINLLLERVLWESTVFIDGEEVSKLNALGSPHNHVLGHLTRGEHTLTICVDNDMIYNIGDKGHAYGEYTQTLWNGIIGKIELQAYDPIHIRSVNVRADVAANTIKARVSIANLLAEKGEMTLTLHDDAGKLVTRSRQQVNADSVMVGLAPSVALVQWSEHNPVLYTLTVDLKVGKNRSSKRLSVGFREVTKQKNRILLNNRPVFLRGNNDCGLFPLKGYPPMDIDEWKAIFAKYKAYGLNHVRFHSWCPPEAAFEAADQIGIYIQAEAAVWIDSWMEVDMSEKGRAELATRGKPLGLGRGDLAKDDFVKRELANIVNWYGNHPSLLMVCVGNELGSSDFEEIGRWVEALKAKDPSRLYAASTARTITPYCDYAVTHDYPSLGQVRQRMYNHNNWDYEELLSQVAVPTIAHEIGQWPTHPVWAENTKYQGNLKAWNLDQLAQLAKQKRVHGLDSQFRLASGKLALLLYKDEIESYLRTPSATGFQLLGMQDYTGQGEALIGWLDAFYDEKGITSPSDFKQFCNEVVPLVKLTTYSWKEGQTMNVPMLLHQYAAASIAGNLCWDLKDEHGSILLSGSLGQKVFESGQLHQAGTIEAIIPEGLANTQITLHVWIEGTGYANSWPLWIFPSETDLIASNDIFITGAFDDTAIAALAAGRRVLLIANNLGPTENRALAAWKPLYWSATFFPGQGIKTIGALIQHDHPSFDHFPTSYYSNWQWWNIAAGARGFLLNDFPETYMPIVMPISDFHFSDRIGSIFEVTAGGGRLLVCGYDISEANQSIEAKQLRYSILKYMESNRFSPEVDMDLLQLGELFEQPDNQQEAPALADVLLSVLPGPETDGQSVYRKSMDQVLIGDTSSYEFYNVVYQKDEHAAGWSGNDIRLVVKVPQGLLGDLNVVFREIGNECSIKIENRHYSLAHTNGAYALHLPIMREDTQDGEIVMEVSGEVTLQKFEVFTK
ncbi:sugar-binding domain-containing protein [Parapedobacter soli]|uniref:sugar-binding domain-containing protein n=1 Tax=Parapedobacter soli TaxID=416955 RepID=UPI0021C6F845|nr:sugar-binding domain-containing protein [Parapedobacter soli]